MNPILRNTLAVIAGFLLGSMVNMGIIMLSGFIIRPPSGADITTTEGLKASLHLFEPRHFIFPFLAHAIGTFAGSLAAGSLAANNKLKVAVGISVFFLAGGIANFFILPSPLWFTMLDILIAYLPMGYIAGKLTTRK